MSGLPPELAKLNSADKIELARLLMDSVPDEDIPVPDFHRELLAERLADYHANPTEGQPWREVIAELENES